MIAMIIPGNGGADVSEIWIPYVKQELENVGFTVIAKNMPDAELARKKYWLPFIDQHVADNENIILVGHSSGAVAAMRYAEAHKVQGVILVCACHTDLGLESERVSGYYDTPWQWDIIKKNASWIVQFASTNDPFIPIEEARFIHKQLNTDYYENSDYGHYNGVIKFPELVEAVKKHVTK
jgi:uncharacterized protein